MMRPRRPPTPAPTDERRGPRRSLWRRLLAHLLLFLFLLLVVLPPLVLFAYRYVPPPITPLMVIRAFQGHGIDRAFNVEPPLSPPLARAVIASEDNLFCEHWGFDVAALRAQLDRALAGERPRGASSLTQQTAKNLFLWPGRDPLRKVLEMWLAPQLELILGKRRILELYLGMVEFGPGIYGAEAASRAWFDKPAAQLTPREAARLAVILPAPLSWRPDGAYADRRSQVILQRIDQLGPLLDCAA